MTKRAGDGNTLPAWWGRYGRDVVTFVAVCLSAWAVIGGAQTANEAKRAVAAQRREAKERINESCTINERKQKVDVDQLARTYAYLEALAPDEKGSALNRAIVAQLPTTEAAAREDDAPSYCDKPGVGLPEPDDPIPPRPASLR